VNRQEVSQLLALAALVDNRTVTPEAVLMWHGILGDLPADAAMDALKAHYAESTEWLLPAHIRGRVLAVRRAALPATMSETRADCPEGRHRRLGDGTCMLCTDRRAPSG
jgi:hypothetical protein